MSSPGVYPNPAVSMVTVRGSSLELSELKLFTMNGEDVSAEIYFTKIADTIIKMDVSSLPAGMYAIKTKSKVTKLIKQ